MPKKLRITLVLTVFAVMGSLFLLGGCKKDDHEHPTEHPTKEAVEKSAEHPTKEAVEGAVEKAAEHPTKEVVEGAVEKAAEHPTEHPKK